MPKLINRRRFLACSTLGTASALTSQLTAGLDNPLFHIALHENSLQGQLQAGRLQHLDFAAAARQKFGIDAVVYSSRFFAEKIDDSKYLEQMNKRAAAERVRQLLIAVEGDGRLDDPDPHKKQEAVQRHCRWIDAAQALGCQAISTSLSPDSREPNEQQLERATAGLAPVVEYAAMQKIGVLIPNTSGVSQDPVWLTKLVKRLDSSHCGILGRFGGFGSRNPYEAMKRVMPFVKNVCATAWEFDQHGNETHIDYFRMMKIVLEADYRGYVGIEYLGEKLDELDGIRATRKLLRRVQMSVG